MKRTVCICMTAALAFSMLAGTAAAAAPAPETPSVSYAEENCISGGWKTASSPELTNKVKSVFDKAFEGLVGASYTPVALLATRTTATGTQYRVLCKTCIVYPGAEEQYAVVTLSKSWLGRAKIEDIGDALCPTALAGDELAMGGWQEAASPALTEDALAAFRKATNGLLGVDYTPVALLSTQVVAGTNYRILCEATAVYPGAETHYVVMTIYESLDGTASILSVSDSAANEAAQ